MALVLFVGGFAIAPTMIATMSLTEQAVPPGRLTEGMAIMHTGLVAGSRRAPTLGGLRRRPPRRLRRLPRGRSSAPASAAALAAQTAAPLAERAGR